MSTEYVDSPVPAPPHVSGLFHRPARSVPAPATAEPMTIRRPPVIEDAGAGGMGLIGLIPLIGMAGSMTVMMLFRGSPFAAVGALMMVVTVIGAIVMLTSQAGKAARRRRASREVYLEYLEQCHHQLLDAERDRRERERLSHPAPAALTELVANPHRLWERRRTHTDFLRVRLGIGTADGNPISLEGDDGATQRTDAHLQHQLAVLQRRFGTTPEMPLTLPLADLHTVSLVGDETFCTQTARSMVLQLCALHSPEDLELAFVIPEDRREEWSWVRRLPHVLDQSQPTAWGPTPRIAQSLEKMTGLLRRTLQHRYQSTAELRRNMNAPQALRAAFPRLVVIDLSCRGPVDGLHTPGSLGTHELGVTVVHAVHQQRHEPSEVAARVLQLAVTDTSTEASCTVLGPDGSPVSQHHGAIDQVERSRAVAISRMVAPVRLSADSLEHDQEQEGQRYTALLGLDALSEEQLQRLWAPRLGPDFLSVPIGTDAQGGPVILDIKEAAQHGMGPHGLCVGATGSGKSELLRSLVLGLTLTHSPDSLNLVLVDYKGGATFAPFAGIPHVSGIVTNLADDVSLVDRIYSSLEGEILRRQELLKSAGNIASITEYRRARQQRPELAPMPHLFLVIDEFGELLTAQPDFIDLFMSIGRIGRSIGVHLLLSSQRLEAGRLRGLDTYLSYRLGLRTLSEAESRTVLETPDAFHLPPLPGYGYLKVDTTVYEQFKAGYVSGPLSQETETDPEPSQRIEAEVVPEQFFASDMQALVNQHAESPAQEQDAAAPEQEETDLGPSVLDAAVDLMRHHPRVTDPIWLPPLPDMLPLDRALKQPRRNEDTGPLTAVIGLLDDPAHQWQGCWELDLTRAGGHVALLGGPSTGKTGLLRTIALSLALKHTPAEVSFFGLDLKGSGLLSLRGLPHTAGMAARSRRDELRRTLEEVADLLTERELLFERLQIDSVETMRRLFHSGEVPELDVRDVVLFVDGWGALLDEFEELQELLFAILTRGGGFGIHVIGTATRWNEIRLAQQSFFASRIELRLTDPGDSLHGSKVAAHLPSNRPGRGFDVDGLIGQVALPRIDGAADEATVAAGFAAAGEEVSRRHPVPSPRTVRMLPPMVNLDDLPASGQRGRTRLGLVERDHSVRHLDLFGKEPHLMVLGDEEAGKSTLIATLAAELMSQYSPDELVFAVFDPRRELQEVVPEEYLGGYATSALLAEKLSAAVVQELSKRVSDDALSPGNASWDGPQVVLLVDDYDVLTAGGTSPLHAFTPYLPMSQEIGFHTVLTRRVRGANRTLYEPFSSALREAGATCLIMDGDHEEGPLIGRLRARRMPPGRALVVRPNENPQTVQCAVQLEPPTGTD